MLQLLKSRMVENILVLAHKIGLRKLTRQVLTLDLRSNHLGFEAGWESPYGWIKGPVAHNQPLGSTKHGIAHLVGCRGQLDPFQMYSQS